MQIDNLADAIQDILDGYQEEVVTAIEEAGRTATEECRKLLRQNSPKRFGRYARSWAVKEVPGRPGEPIKYIVYNKKHYRLTHLLEKGHLIKKGNKVVGRAPAQVHIAPVEEQMKEKFLQDVEVLLHGN